MKERQGRPAGSGRGAPAQHGTCSRTKEFGIVATASVATMQASRVSAEGGGESGAASRHAQEPDAVILQPDETGAASSE